MIEIERAELDHGLFGKSPGHVTAGDHRWVTVKPKTLASHDALEQAYGPPEMLVRFAELRDAETGRIGTYETSIIIPNLNPDKVPFDFYELIAALAPRTFVS